MLDAHVGDEAVAADIQDKIPGVLVHAQRTFQLRRIFLKINETRIIHFLMNFS